MYPLRLAVTICLILSYFRSWLYYVWIGFWLNSAEQWTSKAIFDINSYVIVTQKIYCLRVFEQFICIVCVGGWEGLSWNSAEVGEIKRRERETYQQLGGGRVSSTQFQGSFTLFTFDIRVYLDNVSAVFLTCAHTCFVCVKASGHVVGEENTTDAGDLLCHRFRYWTGRHRNHASRNSPYGGMFITSKAYVWKKIKIISVFSV